ncbi:hypothetical protein Baya_12278 [Bagarius yarrelli]|uniref:Uncharacterized protein n=1 Tax=Bagarius yarrelli TaxID=175774 RepID=A0A556V520_BAGYA|nr:hypothetical protein Baya_12278 [Bagarius yarrelli]
MEEEKDKGLKGLGGGIPGQEQSAQKTTEAITTPEQHCSAEQAWQGPELGKTGLGEARRGRTRPRKPCSAKPVLETPGSVDSGAAVEQPVPAEAGTGEQSLCSGAPVTMED